MRWSHRIRQLHRWLSIAFTLAVLANFATMGAGMTTPPAWVTYAPLPPLFALLFSGLYLFILPYLGHGRRAGPAPDPGREPG